MFWGNFKFQVKEGAKNFGRVAKGGAKNFRRLLRGGRKILDLIYFRNPWVE